MAALTDLALDIMATADPQEKVKRMNALGEAWRSGQVTEIGDREPLDQPARPQDLEILSPQNAAKVGRGGTLASRIAILHALANVEQWAIDTALDNMIRFKSFTPGHQAHPLTSSDAASGTPSPVTMPKAFFDDFIKMALDESKHFTWLNARLHELGSYFGALPVHSGIWDSCRDTFHSALCRFAIVHMVHEARGLDVNPNTIQKFANASDPTSATMLTAINEDEVTHVAVGRRWFQYLCEHQLHLNTESEHEKMFHRLVGIHFRGSLKPPFNDDARQEAGMGPGWYEPIADAAVLERIKNPTFTAKPRRDGQRKR